MNNAQVQQKAKIIKAFENAIWAAILILIFGPLCILIYKDVKVPHPVANILIACTFLGPLVVAVISLPLKAMLLRVIDFRCTSCGSTPPPKTVSYVLNYSLCPCCNKPFTIDPPDDIVRLFAPRINSK
jgi:hypothetical protein